MFEKHSTPIDTLDKEELLKQAKNNVAKKNHWKSWQEFKEKSPDWNYAEKLINNIFEEYLRLCTGGGEK